MLSKFDGQNADVTRLYPEVADSNGAPPSKLRKIESPQTQRREANYLQVIAKAPSSLTAILTSHPYDMPVDFLDMLRTSHGVTGGGVHFSECVILFSCMLLFTSFQHSVSSYQLQPFFQTIL